VWIALPQPSGGPGAAPGLTLTAMSAWKPVQDDNPTGLSERWEMEKRIGSNDYRFRIFHQDDGIVDASVQIRHWILVIQQRQEGGAPPRYVRFDVFSTDEAAKRDAENWKP
jgi:hypothetical protein